jgi:hypothetical protein
VDDPQAGRSEHGVVRRGLGACEAEWKLLCGTHNLLKLWRHATAKTQQRRSPREQRRRPLSPAASKIGSAA